MKRLILTAVIALLATLLSLPGKAAGPCNGHFPDPVTDVCWNCFFPITIAGAPIEPGEDDSQFPPPVCACPIASPPFVRFGVGVTYWSPDRAVEVVRTPMCSPILNGVVLGDIPTTEGDHKREAAPNKPHPDFYHVHWLQMPLLQQLQVVGEGDLCQKDDGSMDFAYMSELDPLWVDDDLAFMLAPESILFANPLAIVACSADVIKASTTDFGFDALFWCSGNNGQVYPLSGHRENHKGGVDAAMNFAHRAAYMLHRTGLLWDTSTVAAMCEDLPQPMLRKGQYKVQFMLPTPDIAKAYGFGVATDEFEQGKEFPYSGEDWGMLIWRRHTCCAF